MRTVTFTKYEWDKNHLLRETEISSPYVPYSPKSLEMESDLDNCDCISIRRTITTPLSKHSAIIEVLYR